MRKMLKLFFPSGMTSLGSIFLLATRSDTCWDTGRGMSEGFSVVSNGPGGCKVLLDGLNMSQEVAATAASDTARSDTDSQAFIRFKC